MWMDELDGWMSTMLHELYACRFTRPFILSVHYKTELEKNNVVSFFSYLASRERNTRLSVSRDQVVVENLASAAFCVLHARGENKRVVPLSKRKKKKTKASSSLRTMKIPRHPGWMAGWLPVCIATLS